MTRPRRMYLSPSQKFCLAWAARPGTSVPPLAMFGVNVPGRAGLFSPNYSSRTWRSLKEKGLVAVSNDQYGTYVATDDGRNWLQANGLLEHALRGAE